MTIATRARHNRRAFRPTLDGRILEQRRVPAVLSISPILAENPDQGWLAGSTEKKVLTAQFHATDTTKLYDIVLDNFMGTDDSIKQINVRIGNNQVATLKHQTGDLPGYFSTHQNVLFATIPAGTTIVTFDVVLKTIQQGAVSGDAIGLELSSTNGPAIKAWSNGVWLATNDTTQTDDVVLLDTTIGNPDGYVFDSVSIITGDEVSGVIPACLPIGVVREGTQTIANYQIFAAANKNGAAGAYVKITELHFVITTNTIVDTSSFKLFNSGGSTNQGLIVTDMDDNLVTGYATGDLKVSFQISGATINQKINAGGSTTFGIKANVVELASAPTDCFSYLATALDKKTLVFEDVAGTSVQGMDIPPCDEGFVWILLVGKKKKNC